ncbi:hypothetical protein Htur_1244 [Haloterrigena turkmenica DSM 5511]|uniref:DUF8136 domain-containing protein n=1 Tax=Haloterrigena turkmenica (strain ATCC 51198 / DSM 5511 / JCM 9101 / NCIMB 13204 / VKM B-1734 / 4k) TaxID=543526 RepID=D2RPA0_HALTV|nr:hypothetical protein [Haloterrigena turkmenica]ADB60134.1 hypothetical protein Htur_1244 [Haloterrigena turkmenica DSM 5511]
MTQTQPSTEKTDREDVLDLLAETIETTHARIELDDAASRDEQELQIKWIRALGYLAGQYRKLLNDEDLDEMAAELDLLKAADGGDP